MKRKRTYQNRELTCKQCKRVFYARRDAKFCSPACKQKNYRLTNRE